MILKRTDFYNDYDIWRSKRSYDMQWYIDAVNDVFDAFESIIEKWDISAIHELRKVTTDDFIKQMKDIEKKLDIYEKVRFTTLSYELIFKYEDDKIICEVVVE